MRSFLLSMFAVAVLLTTLACGQTSNPVAPAQGNQNDVIRTVEYIPDDACSIYETPLMVGQNMELGTVTVSNNEGNLYFDVALSAEAIADGWVITETHADVYESLDGIPQTKKGNPKVGQFAYDIDSAVLLEEGWTTVYVAIHAALERVVDGEVVQEETGWGNGESFDGNSWAMWFTYDIGDCCWVDVGLPTDTVNSSSAHPGAGGYWGTTLSNVPAGHDVGNGLYTGWCVEDGVFMNPGETHITTLYSSYDPNLPSYATDGIDWPRINYVLNHKVGSDYNAIQYAIWYFTSDRTMPGPGDAYDMIQDAIANGGGFQPGYGDAWAIILDSHRASGERRQLCIIEVNPCD